MARTALTATTPTAIASNGTNISDLSGTTMSTGSGNGVEITYKPGDIILLDNITGGNAIFTLVSPPSTQLTVLGASLTDATITVATTKKHIIPPLGQLDQGGSNRLKIFIDCDVAAKIALIRMSAQT